MLQVCFGDVHVEYLIDPISNLQSANSFKKINGRLIAYLWFARKIKQTKQIKFCLIFDSQFYELYLSAYLGKLLDARSVI